MHDFDYQNGKLFCEGVALNELASTYGTPLYVYSQNTIKDNFNRLSSALSDLDHHIAFAVKSNSNLSVLKLLKNIGADFDIDDGAIGLFAISASRFWNCRIVSTESLVFAATDGQSRVRELSWLGIT